MKCVFTTFRSTLILVAIMLLGYQNAKAQIASDYGFSIHSGTYPSLSSNALAIPQLTSWGGSVAINSTTPFVFNYCGVNYDTFTFNSFGYMSFGLRHTSQYTNSLPNAASLGPACMVLWDEHYMYNSKPKVEIQGTIPYRVFIFEWEDTEFPSYYGVGNIKFQIRLYETTNVIEYVYGPGTSGPSNQGTGTVGIYSPGSYLTLNEISNNAVASSSRFTTNIKYQANFPYGTIFRWTPPEPCGTANLNPIKIDAPPIVCNGDSVELKMDFSAMPRMAYTLTYVYQYKDNPTDPWTNLTSPTSNRSHMAEPITGPRYYRAEIYCNGSLERATDSILVNVGTPQAPGTQDVTRCGYGTLTLNASGSQIHWFDGPEKANPIALGNNFTTPMLGDTTYYYVSNAYNRKVIEEQVVSHTQTWNGGGLGPYHSYYPSSNYQYLVYASTLQSLGYVAGNISAITFEVLQASNVPMDRFTLSMKNTNAVNITSLDFTNLTQVYTVNNYTAVNGFNKHEFQTPFYWDGTSNILVSVCKEGTNYPNVYDYVNMGYDYVAGRQNVVYYQNILSPNQCNAVGGYSAYERPLMLFEMVTGCESQRVKVAANVKPAPAFNAVSHRPEVCYGDSTYLIGYSMINPNYQYKWDGSNIVGNTYTVFPYLDSNYYSVKAFDSVLGSPNYGCEAYDTILVAIAPNPEVYLTPNNLPTVCPGVIQSVSAISPDAIQFQWFFNGSPIHGATTPYFGTSQPGYYSVLVTDANGCDSMSETIEKTISSMPSVSIGYNADLEFCQGSSVILTIPQKGGQLNYQWYKDGNLLNQATDSFYEVTSSGKYTVYIEDPNNNCQMTGDTLVVKVHALPTPVVNRTGTVLSTSNYVNYQWLRNNQYLAGETNQSMVVTLPGIYCVEVTDSNGCMNRSALVNLSNLSVDEALVASIHVYPNPTNGTLHIEAMADVNIELFTMTGQLVFKKDNIRLLTLDQLPNGIYMLHIKDQNNQLLKTEKVTKY